MTIAFFQIKFLHVRKYDIMSLLIPGHMSSNKTQACFFSKLIIAKLAKYKIHYKTRDNAKFKFPDYQTPLS